SRRRRHTRSKRDWCSDVCSSDLSVLLCWLIPFSDQSEVDPKTVLTSTVEQIDELYQSIAEKYNERGLQGEVLSLDFQDGLIVLRSEERRVGKESRLSVGVSTWKN